MIFAYLKLFGVYIFKVALVGLFISIYPNTGFALTCSDLLGLFEDQVNALLKRSYEQRKSMEDRIHESIGTLSPPLERQLKQIFRFNNRFSKNQQIKISRALSKDPIAKKLSDPSKSKLIRLVSKGYARPYMAFLIARYMEEKENRQGLLTHNVTYKIEYIVLSYTIEWTVKSLIKSRSSDLNDREKLDILKALRNPEIHKTYGGLKYKDLKYRNHYNLFMSYFEERKRWIASTNIFNLSENIFE